MQRISSSFLAIPLALLAVAATPLDAEAKCGPRPGSAVLPGYVYIVDGEVKGEFAMDQQAEYPPSDDVLMLEVTCLRARGGDDPNARQAAVVVVTRQGAEKMLTTYLRDLVVAQEEHRARTGAFASDLAALGFLEAHVDIPLQMEVSEAGFAATATLGGSERACRVAVGSFASEGAHRSSPGTPQCWRR